MNGLLAYLLIGLSLGDSIQGHPYPSIDRYNDSLRIHKYYASQLHQLATLKNTEVAIWREREISDDTATACARRRLQLWNHKTYEPDSIANREGYGTAYHYPKPGELVHVGSFIEHGVKLHYISYDLQTRFLTDSLGKTRIPYVTKTIFDKGRIISTEKLNAVTLEPLR